MIEVINFTILGLGLGALYALSAQGLVQIYRGAGVVNFAHGALAMFGAYVYYELSVTSGLPPGFAVVLAVGAAAALGVAFELGILNSLRRAAPITRVVATLALFILIQGLAIYRYGADVVRVPSLLPQSTISAGDIVVPLDRLIVLGIGIALTSILWWSYRYTRFGIATAAVAENSRAASTAGLSPRVIAATNWALGSALAAVAGILITPITTLSVTVLSTLVIASIAAALIGRFVSFPLALAGGLILGVAEVQLQRWTTQPGLHVAVPLLMVIGVLALRSSDLPLRDVFLQRQPRVGSGQVRPGLVLCAIAVFAVVNSIAGPEWSTALIVTFTVAMVILSIVVLTGYCGQLSLAQWALAWLGAFIAGRLVDSQGFPLELAIVGGVIGTAIVGTAFALPAIRTRGVNLAIVTLCLGTVIGAVIFENTDWTGGDVGTVVNTSTLFGLNIDPVLHPERYATVCFTVFVLLALVVANVRRGRVGRRMLAVRTNERAAAALGVSVPEVKLYAFTLAAGIAAFGGIFAAFNTYSIVFADVDLTLSITLVGFAVLGGIGWIAGSFIGATFAVGALGTQILESIAPGSHVWAQTFGGVVLLAILIGNPDGLAREMARTDSGASGGLLMDIIHPLRTVGRLGVLLRRTLFRVVPPLERVAEKRRKPDPLEEFDRISSESVRRARPDRAKALEVEGVTARFGSVVAVDDVSIWVRPGEVVGLIGPNGAGKTTLIDAVTGFVPPVAGSIRLADEDIADWSVDRRSRAGLSRSFQGLELFDDMTVLENLQIAAEPHNRGSYLGDLVYPKAPPLHGEAVAAIREFGLRDYLDRNVEDLPYGVRRLVAIARAVAATPHILLLDEPAAGLSEVESRELEDLVRRLAVEWGLGILLVEHDVRFVLSVCDRVTVLDFGRVISEGEPEVVQKDPEVIRAYLGTGSEDDEAQYTPSGVPRDRIT
jgi:ABC-type branched-subunit amino acid transport system ATPase component/branched-subunit amino acid ABC-type transport system permease component